ncbi:alanine racemase, partial [bacterium]|nr:alanine racemase [bacterium]
IPDSRVTVLGGILPEQAATIIEAALDVVVYDADQAHALDNEGRRQGRIVGAHFKVDTGMTRLGVRFDEALPLLKQLRALRNVGAVGLMTHLSTADQKDSSFTKLQLDRFDAFLESSGLQGHVTTHAANSAAILWHPRSLYDMARPGLMIYGISPSGATPPGIELRPVLKLSSRIVRIASCKPGECVGYGSNYVADKPMLVAIVPIGYADGFAYSLTDQADALISGMRCPIIGPIAMDMIAVRLRDGMSASIGNEVVLIGGQGKELITVQELAFLAGTIPYEILCGLSERIDRIYVEDPEDG